MRTSFAKKSISLFLTAALGICALLPTLAACGGEKDEPQILATLTLSAGGGGTLEETEYLVEVGKDLNFFLTDKAPTPDEGLFFGGWFNGEEQLAEGATMPEEGLTLTARYKARVSYFVRVYDPLKIYTEIFGGDTYAWLGETIEYPIPEGYVFDDSEMSVVGITVKKGENNLQVYLNPIYYTVTYYGNPCAGMNNVKDYTFHIRYGEEFYLQDYSLYGEGYRFLGWALAPDGDVVYAADEKLLLDDEIPYAPEGAFYRTLALYAQWESVAE